MAGLCRAYGSVGRLVAGPTAWPVPAHWVTVTPITASYPRHLIKLAKQGLQTTNKNRHTQTHYRDTVKTECAHQRFAEHINSSL